MTAMFPAKLGVLRELLPDRRLVPARLAPGVGLVAVMAIDYKSGDAGAYHEVAFGILLNSEGLNTPVGIARGTLQHRLHVHVLRMPVTTARALDTGRRFWNYPKFVSEIDFTLHNGRRTCTLSEQSHRILTLDAPDIPAPGSELVQYISSTYMDGQPQYSEFRVNALAQGETLRYGAATIDLGTGYPMADELDRALIGRRSVRDSWIPKYEAILFGPWRS
jgi:hypothetical protein